MKIFKFIVVSILTLITIQTAYLALLYKSPDSNRYFSYMFRYNIICRL